MADFTVSETTTKQWTVDNMTVGEVMGYIIAGAQAAGIAVPDFNEDPGDTLEFIRVSGTTETKLFDLTTASFTFKLSANDTEVS